MTSTSFLPLLALRSSSLSSTLSSSFRSSSHLAQVFVEISSTLKQARHVRDVRHVPLANVPVLDLRLLLVLALAPELGGLVDVRVATLQELGKSELRTEQKSSRQLRDVPELALVGLQERNDVAYTVL